ncbi:MAG: hypothetical protein LBQ91_06305 [Oscillospiraceae bacterium]|jgi:hypothetical protein|nr:hypothetical protein [Oscillospiraceae bacterium]
MPTQKHGAHIAEAVFDAAYLAAALVLGILLLRGGRASRIFGVAALVLAAGDSCHLLPRMLGGGLRAKGAGKAVASVTMTLFYLIILQAVLCPPALFGVLYALAAVRIVLCLLPQNRWLSDSPPRKWGILRNAPFTVLGLIIAALFAAEAGRGLAVCAAILVSFACYLPVVLWADKKPKLGMLMLPKSMAYIAILLLGFGF